LIYTGVNGHLPGDKKAMLEHLEGTIGFIEAGQFPVVDSNMLHDQGLMTYL
jgi:hypothetical protein